MEQQPQQTRRRQCAVVLFFASALVATTSDMTAEAWGPSSRVASFGPRHHQQQQRRCRHASKFSQLYSSEEDITDEDRTSFDDAGRALKEEEDQEAMESMGDFDENPSVGACIARIIFSFAACLLLPCRPSHSSYCFVSSHLAVYYFKIV